MNPYRTPVSRSRTSAAPGSVSASCDGPLAPERVVRLQHPRPRLVERAERLGREAHEPSVAHGPLGLGHPELSLRGAVPDVGAPGPTDEVGGLLIGEAEEVLEMHDEADREPATDPIVGLAVVPGRDLPDPRVVQEGRGGVGDRGHRESLFT